MILQTTGGFSHDQFPPGLIRLGWWCAADYAIEPSIMSTYTDDGFEKTQSEADRIISTIESHLYQSLNKVHSIDWPTSFWRESLGVYLKMMIPLLVRRRRLLEYSRDTFACDRFTAIDVDIESIVPANRQCLLEIINSHAWNHFVLGELCRALGLKPVQPKSKINLRFEPISWIGNVEKNRESMPRRILRRVSNALAMHSPVLIVRSMLPRMHEILLAIRRFSLPYSWEEPVLVGKRIDLTLRTQLVNENLFLDEESRTIARTAIQLMPRTFLEDFEAACNQGSGRLKKLPRVVFTSNLHLASDVFLIWLARAHFKGTKVVISQHGGVHSLCRQIPGDLQAERDLADTYITWGAPTFESATAISGPTLVNVGISKSQRTRDNDGPLLVVLDSTYRYLSVPRGVNGSKFNYATFVNQLLENIDVRRVPRVIIRAYRGTEAWDESLVPLLSKRDSFHIDDGVQPIQNLFDTSRLVVQTGLGTTLFQTIHQGIPTTVMFHEELSPLSASAFHTFSELKKSGVYFNDPLALAVHINTIFDRPQQWWSSFEVSRSIHNFSERMSPNLRHPVQFYNQVLQQQVRGDKGRF